MANPGLHVRRPRFPIERIWPLLPFIGRLIITMLIITYVEDFSMFLPRLMHLTD